MKVDREALESLAGPIRRRELGDAEWAMLEAVIAKLVTILTLLEGKGIDLERFAHTLPGCRKRRKPDPDPPSTDDGEEPSPPDPDPPSPPKRKGHDRKPSRDYRVSETVECADPDPGPRKLPPRVGLAGPAAVGHVVRAALARAGIRRSGRGAAHFFRHSLATRIIRHGASVAEIADQRQLEFPVPLCERLS